MTASKRLRELLDPKARLLRALDGKGATRSDQTRPLTLADVSPLRALELEKWGPQGASEAALAARIERTPGFCWGTFDSSGRALASLFVMGVQRERVLASRSWFETTDEGTARSHDPTATHWFGISLSSRSSSGASEVILQAVAEILHRGIREVYLGAPVPGFGRWLRRNPGGTIDAYVKLQSAKGPPSANTDPLLYFYLKLGFRVVQALPNYFPSPESLDHGVLIRFPNRLWRFAPLFRAVGTEFLRRRVLPLVARVDAM